MPLTLDQLLDETGVKDLAGRRHVKTASAPKMDFAKLAERCRRAATATSEEQANSNNQDLVEKTAAIAVIGRTLAEIREIDGEPEPVEKVAAVTTPAFNVESFIKTALDKGHTPEDIAAFLEKNAIFGGIGRALHGARAGLRSGRAAAAGMKAEMLADKATRSWQGLARKYEQLSPAKKAHFVEKLRGKFNDKEVRQILSGASGFHEMPAYKALAAAPKAIAPAAGAAPAGALGGVAELANKYKKPAALIGAGFGAHKLLSERKPKPRDDDHKVVVVD